MALVLATINVISLQLNNNRYGRNTVTRMSPNLAMSPKVYNYHVQLETETLSDVFKVVRAKTVWRVRGIVSQCLVGRAPLGR